MRLVSVSKPEEVGFMGSLPARWSEVAVHVYIYATCTTTNQLYKTVVRKPLPLQRRSLHRVTA